MLGIGEADAEMANNYLRRYGYLGVDIETLQILEAFKALAEAANGFASFAGVSGWPSAISKMQQPRCAMPDVLRSVENARWRKNRLTYFIQQYPTSLSRADVDDLVRLALADWEKVADVKFSQVSNTTADIIVGTERMDGPSGTLAWAYLPSGDDSQLTTRWDSGETWTKTSGTGILLRNVTCHEFGHILGLEHSRVSSALMAPFYSPNVVGPQQSDDIPRIVGLYGAANPAPSPNPTPTPTPTPSDKFRFTVEVNKTSGEVKVFGL